MDRNYVAMFDAKVVADHTVHPRTTVVEIVVGKDNQNRILPLLALNKDGVTTEELQCFHSVVGKRDDGVVIVRSIGDTTGCQRAALDSRPYRGY